MSEGNNSKDAEVIVLNLMQQLEVQKSENEKLQRRMQGYETVAKLANDRQKAFNELESHCVNITKELCELKAKKHEEQKQPSLESKINNESGGTACEEKKNDAASMQGLTDLQSASSSTNSRQGSSSSFTVLGKTSRDPQINLNSVPKFLSSCDESNGNDHQEEFQVLYHPQKQDGSNVEKGSLNAAYNSVANSDKSQSSSYLKEGQKAPKSNTSDENIQVFPMQSGGSSFLDSQVVGGQSCTNSSQRGPMSLVIVNGSLPSLQYVEMKKGNEKNDAEQNKSNELMACDARPLATTGSTQHSDLFSGTGARPKDHPVPHIPFGEEECAHTDLKPPASNSEATTTNILVKIPCENSDAYRINNAPMLSYGREESRTEISALTSFESSLSSLSPQKMITEAGMGKYNNLSMAGHNSQRNLQEKNTEDFVIIEEAPPVDPVIPAIMPVSDDTNLKDSLAKLTKDFDRAQKTITQLHLANKEWKSSWDILQKQKDDKFEQLRAQMNKVVHEKDQMIRDMEYRITSQKMELNQTNLLKKEAEKSYLTLLTGRAQEKQLLEKLKQDYGTLHQDKRALEVQLEIAQANKPTEELRPTEISKTNSEMETELAVIKRQVTLYLEDFEKEHSERLVVEKRLQKEKESSQSLETKLRKTHSLLKSRDEELRQKSKLVADLQFEVADIKLKLEIEQRRASIYPSMDFMTHHPTQEVNAETSCEPDPTVGPRRNDSISAHVNLNVHAPRPTKWRCSACTFDNKISHKKCDICGKACTSTEVENIEVN